MKLTTQKENDDVVSGYLDGFSDTRDELPDSLQNRSHLYIHGWMNGRDDRTGAPVRLHLILGSHLLRLKIWNATVAYD